MSKSMLGQVMGGATAMALALLGVAAQAEAEVISVNGLNRDLATNLDWLNLTATQGQSYQAVDASLAGGALSGYRRANTSEVVTYLDNIGLHPGGPFNTEAQANALISRMQIVGITVSTGGTFAANGFTNSPNAYSNANGLVLFGVALTISRPSSITIASVSSNGVLTGNPSMGNQGIGHWLALRSGVSAANPILPNGTDCGSPSAFCFNPTPVLGSAPTYFDPVVSVGYDFESHNSLNFQKVVVPNAYGDGLFDLFLFDEALQKYVDSGTDLIAGVELDLASLGFANGVSRFSLRGIEPSANLDPADPQAFVTGLTFSADGIADIAMIPLTFDTDAVSAVPEPGSIALLAAGLAGLGMLRRRAPNPQLIEQGTGEQFK